MVIGLTTESFIENLINKNGGKNETIRIFTKNRKLRAELFD